MEKKFLSTTQFEAYKKEAIKNEPLIKLFNMSQLKLEDDSIEHKYVKLNNKIVKVNESFFDGLAKVLNINKKLEIQLSNESDKSYYIKLIEALRNHTALRNNFDISIIANPISKTLVDVTKGNCNRISTETLFNISERLINDNKLQPESVDINGTNLHINLLSSGEDIAFGDANMQNEEMFQFGITLANRKNKTMLGDYQYRLVCQNGMVDLKPEFNFTMNDIDTGNIDAFLNRINTYEKQNFIPETFAKSFKNAIKVNASYREVENAVKEVVKRITQSDENMYKQHKDDLCCNYFKGYSDMQTKLTKQSIDPESLTKKQKTFLNTGIPIINLINDLTFLGSHNIEIPIRNNAELKGVGGRVFKSEFDLSYADLLKI